MKTLTVNIGLSNNKYSRDEVIDRMAADKNYRLMAYTIEESEYKYSEEFTFVGMFEYKYSRDSKILSDFENLASEMTQECIAISTESMDALAYSPNYNGERMKFDSDHFKIISLRR
jgi:hypothetical protein